MGGGGGNLKYFRLHVPSYRKFILSEKDLQSGRHFGLQYIFEHTVN